MAAVPVVLAALQKEPEGLGYSEDGIVMVGDQIDGERAPSSCNIARTIRAAGVIQRFLRRRTIRTRLGEPALRLTLPPCQKASEVGVAYRSPQPHGPPLVRGRDDPQHDPSVVADHLVCLPRPGIHQLFEKHSSCWNL